MGNVPLIEYIQRSLLEVEFINERYVFCSNEEIKNFLLSGTIFLKRNEKLDLPISNFTQIFESFIELIQADIYVYAHATAPFVKAETVRECVKRVLSGEYDSAFCAVKIQDYLWQNGKPLNFNANNLPRSQDLEIIYRETSGVYVFTREVFEKYHRRIGDRPFIKEVNFIEAIDINEGEDFNLAETMLKQIKSDNIQNKLEKQALKLNKIQCELDNAKKDYNDILQSTSWKITKPIRAFKQIIIPPAFLKMRHDQMKKQFLTLLLLTVEKNILVLKTEK